MLSGTTSSRTVTRCALSAPAERDLRFLPVLLGWISPTPYSPDFSLLPVVFLRRAQWILSVAVGDFSDDLQLKFPSESINVSEKRS